MPLTSGIRTRVHTGLCVYILWLAKDFSMYFDLGLGYPYDRDFLFVYFVLVTLYYIANMRFESVISAVGLLVVSASAHGNITSPPARLPGPAMQAACGAQTVGSVEADPTIPLEGLLGTTSACESYHFVERREAWTD